MYTFSHFQGAGEGESSLCLRLLNTPTDGRNSTMRNLSHIFKERQSLQLS